MCVTAYEELCIQYCKIKKNTHSQLTQECVFFLSMESVVGFIGGRRGIGLFAADGNNKILDQVDQKINELNEFVDGFFHVIMPPYQISMLCYHI